jgi:DNA-binding transcriptional ArsR family regulator
MAITVNARDIAVLTTLAEYRLLTVHQLAVIHRKNIRALRRRLRELAELGMVEIDTQAFGRRRGRPEGIISLGEPGLQLLKKESAIRADVLFDGVGRQGVLCLEHQLLVNDCRVQLAGIGRVVPTINAQFFSHQSPFADRLPDGRTLVQEQFQAADTGERVQFVPDGVFRPPLGPGWQGPSPHLKVHSDRLHHLLSQVLRKVQEDIPGPAIPALGQDPATDQGVHVQLVQEVAEGPAGDGPQTGAFAEGPVGVVGLAGSHRLPLGFMRGIDYGCHDRVVGHVLNLTEHFAPHSWTFHWKITSRSLQWKSTYINLSSGQKE